jgi:hypothetical protein
MSKQSIAATVHPLVTTTFPGHQPWDAPDPLPVMRRELKLLLIEINVLRVEVEQLRALNQEGRNTEQNLSASVGRATESRDEWKREANRWRREAERLSAIMAQVSPWSLLWRYLHSFKAWRKPTDDDFASFGPCTFR